MASAMEVDIDGRSVRLTNLDKVLYPSGFTKAEVVDYVLRKPTAEHRELIGETIARSTDALDLLLAGEMERAMMKVHVKPPRPKVPRAEPAPTLVRDDGPSR